MSAVVDLGEQLVTAVTTLQTAIATIGAGSFRVDRDAVITARRLVDLAEVLCTRAVGVFAADQGFRDDGYPDIGSWMAANTKARQHEGLTRRDQHQVLDLLPQLAAAVDAGDIGINQLRILTTAVTKERELLAQRDESVLVHWAATLSVFQYAQFINKWAALCDDELHEPIGDEAELLTKRSLTLHQLQNGNWKISGTLDPLSGETVQQAIEAAMPKPTTDDRRTVPQRRHDALVDICAESLRTSDRPIVGGERPNVTLYVEASNGLAYTPQLFFLSHVTRDMVMCDCAVTAVWLTADGKPFDVGTPTSEIPLRNRKAIRGRDRCCRYPGCSRPGRWTEIHHMKHREHGGTHELDNLVLLCRFHHRLIHTNNLTLSWAIDKLTLLVQWPNGIIMHSPPMPTTIAVS